jgi:hypothetical protein
MAVEYGTIAQPFILYDGTNSAEVVAMISERLLNEGFFTVDITSVDEDEMVIFVDNGSSGTGYRHIPTGYRVPLAGGEPVSPTDWAAQYVKP